MRIDFSRIRRSSHRCPHDGLETESLYRLSAENLAYSLIASLIAFALAWLRSMAAAIVVLSDCIIRLLLIAKFLCKLVISLAAAVTPPTGRRSRKTERT